MKNATERMFSFSKKDYNCVILSEETIQLEPLWQSCCTVKKIPLKYTAVYWKESFPNWKKNATFSTQWD